MTAYWCSQALLPSGIASSVLIEVADGRFAAVTVGAPAGDAVRLRDWYAGAGELPQPRLPPRAPGPDAD